MPPTPHGAKACSRWRCTVRVRQRPASAPQRATARARAAAAADGTLDGKANRQYPDFGSLVDGEFLQTQGQARHLRVVQVPAHRGMIVDRNGEPLAISTPVQSVWVNPGEMSSSSGDLARLAQLLELDVDHLRRLIGQRQGREFVYLRRHIAPDLAEQVTALELPGVYLQQEYRRYYPAGEVAGHLLGFTNVDDKGQEGLELAFEDWLSGEPGAKRVIMDGRRNIVENVENIRSARPGKTLKLSIDRRIQYLAYRELKAAVRKHSARSGSLVVLDSDTGEVLAMVNQPSYNPNNSDFDNDGLRTRAVTDVFEPGSVMKPFAVAAALAFMGSRAENWPKDRLEGMTVFFSQVGYKPTAEWKEECVFWDPLSASTMAGNSAPGSVKPGVSA